MEGFMDWGYGDWHVLFGEAIEVTRTDTQQ